MSAPRGNGNNRQPAVCLGDRSMKVRKSPKNMQKDDLPSFGKPPVIETVIGVQFDPIPNLTSAHFGWYWRDFLGKTWVRTQDAMALPDQIETFGEQTRRFPFPSLSATLLPSDRSPRIQFINENDDRVTQIQNTRFIYNWRKREAAYPRFKDLYPEFTAGLSRFREFLRSASLGDATFNQWEVTYINHIEKGETWKTPEDWHKVLPGLLPPSVKSPGVRLERESGELVFEIVPERGRLYVQIGSGRSPEGGNELLALQLTARGPVNPNDSALNLESGIALGHRVIVETFADVSSESAQKFWGRKEL
jgi:uncharacterized protein (TIGR04255 family)